jgi:polyhydroxyalkanoate synthase
MHALIDYAGSVHEALSDAVSRVAFGGEVFPRPRLAPTPRDVIHREGTAALYRFRRPAGVEAAPALPVLLVPSLINRWYVLDLRARASVVEALTTGGLDTFCLDWGVPRDEDRYLTWDDVLARLARAVRIVRRTTGAPRVGLLGYCMGGTLAGIHTALEPDTVAALINLAGPFDFARGGLLATMTDPRWFDAEAIAAAGNVSPTQMQSGFVALRPTLSLSKQVNLLDRGHEANNREAFLALESWSSDNIPFPAAAYTTYIRDLYQGNLLVQGRHHARGRRVDLGAIRCPVLTVAADRDAICPVDAARGLMDHCGARDTELLTVSGGHVGAVVGTKASQVLYPAIVRWLRSRLGSNGVAAE